MRLPSVGETCGCTGHVDNGTVAPNGVCSAGYQKTHAGDGCPAPTGSQLVCVCVWLSIPWVTKPFPQAGAILHGTASGCSYSLKRRPLNVELIIEQNNQKIKREKPPTLAHTGLRHVHTRAHTHTTCLHPLSENKNIPDSLVTVPKHTSNTHTHTHFNFNGRFNFRVWD